MIPLCNPLARVATVGDPSPVIEREAALRMVQDELDRSFTMRLLVTGAEEHELVWIVYYQSEEFVLTRNWEAALAGNGPYLVDRVDGGLHRIGVVSEVQGTWEVDYRSRIRGLPVRTAVDDLHDEIGRIGAAEGRMAAVRELRRRLPVLSPAEAFEYMRALAGGDPPARLVAVATRELVEPLNPVLKVETIRSA
ncbi:hypothetical protein ABH940_000120 [Streptacidiphilus sp. BW17]